MPDRPWRLRRWPAPWYKDQREQLEQVIVAGGSVLHGDQIITRVEDLPSAAQLEKHEKAMRQRNYARTLSALFDQRD